MLITLFILKKLRVKYLELEAYFWLFLFPIVMFPLIKIIDIFNKHLFEMFYNSSHYY